MAIRILEGLEPEWWTPDNEKEEAQPSAFFLAPLTGPEMLEVQAHFDQVHKVVTGPGLLAAARIGLKGWRNIVDKKDELVPFTKQAIETLDAETLAITGAQIIASSALDEDTEGN